MVTCNLSQRTSFDQSFVGKALVGLRLQLSVPIIADCDSLLLRAMLSYWLQPFDEALLADMPFADRL